MRRGVDGKIASDERRGERRGEERDDKITKGGLRRGMALVMREERGDLSRE